jgi:hypothetical protein
MHWTRPPAARQVTRQSAAQRAAVRLPEAVAEWQPRLAALAGGTQVALSRAGLEEATPAALAEVTRAVWEAVIRAEVTRVGLEEVTRVAREEATLAARMQRPARQRSMRPVAGLMLRLRPVSFTCKAMACSTPRGKACALPA